MAAVVIKAMAPTLWAVARPYGTTMKINMNIQFPQLSYRGKDDELDDEDEVW